MNAVEISRVAMPEAGLFGLLMMQVCAYGETPIEEVEHQARLLNPAGVNGDWEILGWDFPQEHKRPVPCEEHPERIHYLLACGGLADDLVAEEGSHETLEE